MAEYRPLLPFTTPLRLLIPTYTTKQGVKVKTFPAVENGLLIYASFKTYGGTDVKNNGILSVEDTASVETWFRPDVKSDCVIAIAGTGAKYEIIGEPENINMRNQFLKFKVKRIKGGA